MRQTTGESQRSQTYAPSMRTLALLAVTAALAAALAPVAGAKTVSIRHPGETADHGRAGATWTAWKVRGVPVGVRLSAITVAGFTTEWTEGHALNARIGLRCKYPTVKKVVEPGAVGKRVLVPSVTAGVPLSIKVPGLSARCLAPSKYVGFSFLGLVIKPYFHPQYVARFAGSGIIPS